MHQQGGESAGGGSAGGRSLVRRARAGVEHVRCVAVRQLRCQLRQARVEGRADGAADLACAAALAPVRQRGGARRAAQRAGRAEVARRVRTAASSAPHRWVVGAVSRGRGQTGPVVRACAGLLGWRAQVHVDAVGRADSGLHVDGLDGRVRVRRARKALQALRLAQRCARAQQRRRHKAGRGRAEQLRKSSESEMYYKVGEAPTLRIAVRVPHLHDGGLHGCHWHHSTESAITPSGAGLEGRAPSQAGLH